MSGKKVLLTYKRKQPSLTAGPARENGKHNLPSGDRETDSQHFHDGKKLCSSCDIGRDSLDSSPNKKDCRVKTEEGGEEANAELVAVCLNESPQVNSCQRDPSIKDPCGQSLVHSSLESSLSQINKTDSAHHDSVVGIVSQTLQIGQCMARSYSNGPGQEKHDFPQGNALILATSNLEVGFSAAEEKTTDVLHNPHGEVKQSTPLLTFSRKRKRKRDVNGVDMASKPSGKREGTSSNVSPHDSNLVNDGGSIGDHTACPIPSGQFSDATAATDQMKGVRSMSARPGIEMYVYITYNCCLFRNAVNGCDYVVIDVHSLLVNREEVPNGEDVPVDASASIGPVLKQDSNATAIKENLSIVCLQNDTIKDLHLEAKNDNQGVENSQSQPVIGDESLTASNEVAEGQPRANHVREVGVHLLDLSVAPSDTCEQKKGIDLNVSLENDSTNGSGRTPQDSLPYKNEVIDHSLQERSPSDASTVVCRRAEELVQIPEMQVLGDSCIAEDFNTKCGTGKSHVVLPAEVPCTRKCMQLFPDKKAEIALDSAVSLLEVADFRDSGAGEMLQLGTSNTCPEQLSGRHSFLGLSLPFAPRFGGCTHRNCSSIPFLSSENESRECMPPLLPSSSGSQKSLLLRHKLMLDGILGRSRALNGHMAWSEEELDYLWIGVRRYGRSNWEAMLRDPRLHFSPFRMARDLAEQWEEEQVKLSGRPCSSQSKISRPQGIPAGYNCGLRRRGGASRRNPMDETRLSLGDLYANRKGANIEDYHRFEQLRRSNSLTRRNLYEDYLTERYENSSFNSPFPSVAESNDGLPHWLREAHIPLPRLKDQTMASYHGLAQIARPYVDSDGPCPRRNNHPHAQDPLMQGVAEWGSSAPPCASKQNDFIIINSDSSSEETISDDNCNRA